MSLLKSPKDGVPTLTNIFWKEFRFLTVVGCSYGFYHNKRWAVFSIANYIISYSISFVMMSLLACTIYRLLDRVSYLCQTLHLFIIGFVFLSATGTLTIHRSHLDNEWRSFYHHPYLCDYAYCGYFEDLIEKTARKKNIAITLSILMYGACGLVGILQQPIDNFFGVSSGVSNVKGAWLSLPFVMWAPGDLDNDWTVWFTVYITQGIFLYYAAVSLMSSCVLCFTTCDRLLDQIRLLIYSIVKLDERATKMFQRKFPNGDLKRMEKEYDDCYYDCIVQNVEHHHKIIEFFKKFLLLANIPIAIPFLGGALMLGMALITFTEEDDPRIGSKTLAATLAATELYNMYTLCVYGQKFQELSLELYNALFFTRWYYRSPRCKKAIQIMRYGCFKPIKFVAGKLMVLDMELFSRLTNSGYSIFNLKMQANSNH